MSMIITVYTKRRNALSAIYCNPDVPFALLG